MENKGIWKGDKGERRRNRRKRSERLSSPTREVAKEQRRKRILKRKERHGERRDIPE